MRSALILLFVVLIIAVIFFVGRFIFNAILGLNNGGSLNSGSGIYVSQDNGQTFNQSSQSDKLNFNRFHILDLKETYNQSGFWAAATDGAGMFLSKDNGKEWLALWGQDDILKDKTVRSFLFLPNGILLISIDINNRAFIWKSSDQGLTFKPVFSAARDSVPINVLASPPQQPDFIMAGLNDGLLISSKDGGETWASLSQFSGAVNQLIFSQSNPSVIYASVSKGGLMRSSDQGKTWEQPGNPAAQNFNSPVPQTSGADTARPISYYVGLNQTLSIDVNRQNENEILAAFSGGLLYSLDGGASFLQLPIPLKTKSVAVLAAVFDPTDNRAIYAATSDSFYASFDNGATWRVTRLAASQNLKIIRVNASDKNNILMAGGR